MMKNGAFRVQEQILLWGLMTGYIEDETQIEVKEAAAYSRYKSNTGMALISPAKYLLDILDSDKAKALRSK